MPPPGPEDDPFAIIEVPPEELFPYVHMRYWPRVNAGQWGPGFVQYLAPDPPCSRFFEDLVAARVQGRAVVEAAALQFVEGSAPYGGVFIGNMESVTGPLSRFAAMLTELRRRGGDASQWLAAARDQIVQLLGGYGLTWDYFDSADCAETLDRMWQSYFALVIRLGCDMHLLGVLTDTLRMAHVTAVALRPPVQQSGPASPAALADVIGLEQIEALCNATIVLPAQVFPLPEAEAPASSHNEPRGWIVPYAIGDLQIVRQRLLRYRSGEIARIENVMRGERREVTHRRSHRHEDALRQATADRTMLQNDAADERRNLQEETLRTVAESEQTAQYNKLTTSYGPPTQAILDGSWSRTVQQGAHPGAQDTTRFARDILNRTVSRISRSVSLIRSTREIRQTEDCVVSLVDNTAGSRSVRAVFRWLYKVYEAYVLNYGQRLMMEFMVPRPAAGFIAQQRALADQDFVKPMTLLQMGVASFEDIQVSGACGYARLGAYYGVLDLEPPPLARRQVSATLRAGEEKQVPVPSGYRAVAAFVSCAGAGNTIPVQVLVGRQTVSPLVQSQSIALHGEDATVPVSVAQALPEPLPREGSQLLVNLEIGCEPSGRCMDEWRIRIYAGLVAGYRERQARYQGCLAGHGAQPTGGRSPLACRQTERTELKGACVRMLLERVQPLAAAGAPEPGAPSAFAVNEPRYLQFLDEVLEWREMTYSFHAAPQGCLADMAAEASGWGVQDDALFASFVQAQQARVLLPVQPAHAMAFLYFYGSGQLWGGADGQVPALEGDVPLVSDLKRTKDTPTGVRRVGSPWQVVVPTTMQVLDDTGTGFFPSVDEGGTS